MVYVVVFFSDGFEMGDEDQGAVCATSMQDGQPAKSLEYRIRA